MALTTTSLGAQEDSTAGGFTTNKGKSKGGLHGPPHDGVSWLVIEAIVMRKAVGKRQLAGGCGLSGHDGKDQFLKHCAARLGVRRLDAAMEFGSHLNWNSQ